MGDFMAIDRIQGNTQIQAHKAGQVVVLPPPNGHPFEVTLNPGEEAILYGNIRFINETNQTLQLKIEFDLEKGFYLNIVGSETTPMHAKMNSTQRISIQDGKFTLTEVEKNPSMRTFRMSKQKV